jgi:hypothetical protein
LAVHRKPGVEELILRQNETMLRRANLSNEKLAKHLAGVRELLSYVSAQ